MAKSPLDLWLIFESKATGCLPLHDAGHLVIWLVVKLPEWRLGLTKQVFGLHENEGLPELPVDLPSEKVEVIGWSGAICYLFNIAKGWKGASKKPSYHLQACELLSIATHHCE